jgi:hypothetical protein
MFTAVLTVVEIGWRRDAGVAGRLAEACVAPSSAALAGRLPVGSLGTNGDATATAWLIAISSRDGPGDSGDGSSSAGIDGRIRGTASVSGIAGELIA